MPVHKRRKLEKKLEENGITSRNVKRAFSPKTTKIMKELKRKKNAKK